MTATEQRTSAPARPLRRRGLLPERMLRWRRPVWWQELAIIAFGYWLYGLGRNAIPKNDAIAFAHARAIQHVQEVLHVDFELSLNHWVAAHEWVAQPMDYYYATLHFIVTPGVLIWLFVKHKDLYRSVRTVIVLTSLLGLLVFYLYPVAPPRLLPARFVGNGGYVDTVLTFHTWGSLANPHVADHSNQYAAMPSLHTAWALWAGLCLYRVARRKWVRVLGLLYPIATITVILGTANHFLLDAVGGVLALAIGFGIQYLLSGHGAFASSPPTGPSAPEPSDA